MIFDGVEVLTDAAIYVFYKQINSSNDNNNNNNQLWKSIKKLSFNQCRYITDFSIDLLTNAIDYQSIAFNDCFNCCPKLLKYKYHDSSTTVTETTDLFLNKIFTKCLTSTDELISNKFKMLILNETSVNVIESLKTNNIVKFENLNDSTILYKYENLNLSITKESKVNVPSKKASKVSITSSVKQFELNTIETNQVKKTPLIHYQLSQEYYLSFY